MYIYLCPEIAKMMARMCKHRRTNKAIPVFCQQVESLHVFEISTHVGKVFAQPMGVFYTLLEPPKWHIMQQHFVRFFSMVSGTFPICSLLGPLRGSRLASDVMYEKRLPGLLATTVESLQNASMAQPSPFRGMPRKIDRAGPHTPIPPS